MEQYKLFYCETCGANLLVNKDEAATFCAYCGQPIILEERVSNHLKPDYILPFCITKEEAVSIIRRKLSGNFLLPKRLRNVTIENVRGIYMPFQLVSIHHHDVREVEIIPQMVDHMVEFKSKDKFNANVEMDCELNNITCNISSWLKDGIAEQLEPYDMEKIRPFSEEYLSGFYADIRQKSGDYAEGYAIARTKEMVEGEYKAYVGEKCFIEEQRKPMYHVLNSTYALLPVWFLLFKDQGQNYIVAMNGQNGKMVGATPCKKRLLFGLALFAFPVGVVLSYAIIYVLLLMCEMQTVSYMGQCGRTFTHSNAFFIAFFCLVKGIEKIRYYLSNLQISKEKETRMRTMESRVEK